MNRYAKKLLVFVLALLTGHPTYAQQPVLDISIDEKIETLYAVAFLDNYFLVSPHDNRYKQLLRDDYKALKDHKAIRLFDTLYKKYQFNGYKIVHWALQFDVFPALNTIRKPAEPVQFVSPGGEALLADFRQALAAFRQDSLFRKYHDEIQAYDKVVLQQVKTSATIRLLPQYLEAYYGTRLSSYHLLLSPLLHEGGFNAEMVASGGQKQVYALVGPNGEIEFLPYFDKKYIETDMILHEFGHSFVNPLTDRYEAEVERLKGKYYTKELAATGKDEGYNEWKYVFNELLLRATTIKITERYFGKEAAKENLDKEIEAGFGLVKTMVKILDEYEQHRDRYPTFEKFCPILIRKMQ